MNKGIIGPDNKVYVAVEEYDRMVEQYHSVYHEYDLLREAYDKLKEQNRINYARRRCAERTLANCRKNAIIELTREVN